MEGQGNILVHTMTHTQDLKNGSKPKIPAQVRTPEGNTTTTRQDAPNHKTESHDTTNSKLNTKKNPVRHAKNDDNKSFGTGNGWNPKGSGCTESDRRWAPRHPRREDNN